MVQARPPADDPSVFRAPAEADVRFDFDGALAVARALHRLAGAVEEAVAARGEAGQRALEAFTGPAAEELAREMGAEAVAGREVADGLRHDAGTWALAWAGAADDRGRQHWLAGVAAGAPDPAPVPVGVPRPPGFEPTGPVVVASSLGAGR